MDFIYYGHFYRLCVDDVEYRCRSTLEIIAPRNLECARAAAGNPGALLDHEPNAVFVMLNPGASHPCDGRERDEIINPCEIHGDARCHLVATCPDAAQQAIENVMLRKQFDHVRVLNLFDIREPYSMVLKRKVRCSLGIRPKKYLPSALSLK